MNKYPKNIDKRKKAYVREIFELCLQINGFFPRTKEETGDLPTVIFDFYGHTSCIVVDVHRNGWTDGAIPEGNYRLYLCDDMYSQKKTRQCRDDLKKILAEMEA